MAYKITTSMEKNLPLRRSLRNYLLASDSIRQVTSKWFVSSPASKYYFNSNYLHSPIF